MASFMSAITLLGVSNENYQFGTQFIVINLSYGIATPIAVYLFLPIFYNLRATSAYEVMCCFLMLTVLVERIRQTTRDLKLIFSNEPPTCLMFTPFVFLVSRESFWEVSETVSLSRVLHPNDSLHGDCALCSSLGI